MIYQMRSILLGLSLLSAGLGQAGELPKTYQPHKLLPVDEARADSSFRAFRDKLMNAITHKDAKFLLSIVDPKIKLSFGGDEGVESFRKLWKPENPASEVWRELRGLLRLGGTFTKSKNEFWAPYVFSRFPDEYDGFSYSAIIARDVKIFSAPRKSAPAIATLSYDIVQTPLQDPEKGKNAGWVHVRLSDGREGFADRQSVRSPTDYRAGFKKAGDNWMLTQFVAGD